MPRKVYFVFGSNEAGRHGKGAAEYARKYHKAAYFKASGISGNSYAIPTKDKNLKVLPLESIKSYVDEFIAVAEKQSEDIFRVTRVGCGLAGYKDVDISPMFKGVPSNCLLPEKWKRDTECLVKWCPICRKLILLKDKESPDNFCCKECSECLAKNNLPTTLHKEHYELINDAILNHDLEVPQVCSHCKAEDTSVLYYVIEDLNKPLDCEWVCRDCLLNWHDKNCYVSIFTYPTEDITERLKSAIYSPRNPILVSNNKRSHFYIVTVDKLAYNLARSGTAPPPGWN